MRSGPFRVESLEFYVDPTTRRSPFLDWLSELKDTRAKARIFVRLERMAKGHFGDWKSLGRGLFECRVFEGPGYRLYFSTRNAVGIKSDRDSAGRIEGESTTGCAARAG